MRRSFFVGMALLAVSCRAPLQHVAATATPSSALPVATLAKMVSFHLAIDPLSEAGLRMDGVQNLFATGFDSEGRLVYGPCPITRDGNFLDLTLPTKVTQVYINDSTPYDSSKSVWLAQVDLAKDLRNGTVSVPILCGFRSYRSRGNYPVPPDIARPGEAFLFSSPSGAPVVEDLDGPFPPGAGIKLVGLNSAKLTCSFWWRLDLFSETAADLIVELVRIRDGKETVCSSSIVPVGPAATTWSHRVAGVTAQQGDGFLLRSAARNTATVRLLPGGVNDSVSIFFVQGVVLGGT